MIGDFVLDRSLIEDPGLRSLVGFDVDFEMDGGGVAPTFDPIWSLVARPAIYQRNGIAWASARCWRHNARRVDIKSLKAAKAILDKAIIAAAAKDISALVKMLLGSLPGWTVSTVAVGHSRRPDSFSVRIAGTVAATLGRPFAKVFADRFVSGVSHPKEFKALPQLQLQAEIVAPILIVDDVATSGWHMEEALQMLRSYGVPAFGVAWISGTTK